MKYEYKCTLPMLPANAESPVMDAQQMESWLNQKGYDSLDEIIGKLSYKKVNKPILYERAQFMKYFSSEQK